jgi:hypothetical protein
MIAAEVAVDEATWRTTHNSTRMVNFVRDLASERKFRLFGCACVRQVWELLPIDCRKALWLAERFAEGEVPHSELKRAEQMVARVAERNPASPTVRSVTQVVVDSDVVLDNFWLAVCSDALQCELARCVFGNPFRPVLSVSAWAQSETARQMAQAITDEGRYADLPILADALEDAGCADEDVLGHCRGGAAHARGCWVVDLILGRD